MPPAPIPESGPALAIIIDDLGPGPAASREAIELPVAVTLSFLPYADDLPMLTAAARARGHEILVHLPMEPIGTEDPGPNALLSRLTPEEMLRRAVWAFDRVPGAVGMNNHMGSRLTAQPAAMRLVLEEARRHGLFFVDSRTSPASIAYDVAERLGMKATSRDVFLDNDPESRAVLDQLDAAERLARRTGTALAIGHPHPSTMKVLANWLPAATSRGLRIVSTSRLIALRSCGVAMVLPVAACVSGGTDCGPKPAC